MLGYSKRKSTINKKSRKVFKKSATSYKKKATPVRFRKGLSTYRKARPMAKALSLVGETKIQALDGYTSNPPTPAVPLPGNGPIYFTNYILGTGAPTWSNVSSLGGFTWPQGTGNDERIGKYMYLKKTTVNIRISMNNVNRLGSQIRFRVVVYKSKRNAIAGTAGGNPSENLFLNAAGNSFGVDTSINNDESSMEFQTALVNKRNYHIVKDTQFILTPQLTDIQGGSNLVTPISQSGPSERTMRLSLGHYQKTAFGVGNQPTDSNHQYGIMILAMPVGNNIDLARHWETAVRGTVSVVDS